MPIVADSNLLQELCSRAQTRQPPAAFDGDREPRSAGIFGGSAVTGAGGGDGGGDGDGDEWADLIRRRTSVRSFSTAGVTPEDLEHTMRGAAARQNAIWGDARRVHGIRAFVAAYRVEGWSPGLYGPAGDGSLTRKLDACSATASLLEDMAEVRYANAPALLLLGGDLAESVAGDGISQYADLLVRCGAFGYSLWLEAMRRGLSCSAYGVASPEVGRLVGDRGEQSDLGDRDKPFAHLFTLAVGHAASS